MRCQTAAADPIETAHVVDARPAGAGELRLAAGSYVALTVRDTGFGMSTRRSGPHLRALLHHQGAGQGHRPRARDRATASSSRRAEGSPSTPRSGGERPSRSSVRRSASRRSRGFDEPAAAPRVLVVEDEPAVRRLVRSVLEGEGYRVHEPRRPRGARFLERRAIHVDLILTDVVMPDIDGPNSFTRLAGSGHSARPLHVGLRRQQAAQPGPERADDEDPPQAVHPGGAHDPGRRVDRRRLRRGAASS